MLTTDLTRISKINTFLCVGIEINNKDFIMTSRWFRVVLPEGVPKVSIFEDLKKSFKHRNEKDFL